MKVVSTLAPYWLLHMAVALWLISGAATTFGEFVAGVWDHQMDSALAGVAWLLVAAVRAAIPPDLRRQLRRSRPRAAAQALQDLGT